VVTAGAKGGKGKKTTPPGVNPFASSDLMALRSTLPSTSSSQPGSGGSAGGGTGGGGAPMGRLSEAEAIAALGGGARRRVTPRHDLGFTY
jgi:hypothetical protein